MYTQQNFCCSVMLSMLLLLMYSWICRPSIALWMNKQLNKMLQPGYPCLAVHLNCTLFVAELTMWRECNNRRPSLYYFSCNSSIPASKGQVWTKWEEAWCFVNREIHPEFVFRKFTRTILISILWITSIIFKN